MAAAAGDVGRSSRPPDLEIVRAANPGPMTLDGTRAYVLGRDRLVIVDPGPDDPSQVTALHEAVAGRPVDLVLLTHAHADHSAAARAVCRRFGARLAASAETLDRLEAPGRALSDGETIALEPGTRLTGLATPGHAADHFCYFVEPGRRLFTGDLVLGEGSSAILYPDGDVAAALASLARLIALRPALLLPGHGPPVEDAMRKLEEYRAHRLDRERQVLAALESGATSVREIRKAVYGPLPDGIAWAADASVAAHLATLARRGHSVPRLEEFRVSGESPG